jgi:molybdopterin-dependent oxidoreductase alpha subunit
MAQRIDRLEAPKPSSEALNGEPPIEANPPTVGPVPSYATGLHAVAKSVQVTIEQMGIGRTLKGMGHVNQFEGFDCPSCAWPDPEEKRSFAEFCENGAKAVSSEATRIRAGRDFFARHSINDLLAQSEGWMDKAGRLTEPMVLRPETTHYAPISWDDAFSLIARELNALPAADAATFYTSGRTSNEAAFLYQLFVRLFGTNNLPDCSNMCHESSGTAMTESIGVGKGTVTIDDFEKADSIWIIGQNPGTNHPRMLSSLLKAKRNGCLIVGVNPLREVGLERFAQPQEALGLLGRSEKIGDLHVQVRINGDIAFLKGVMKEMFEHEDRGEKVIDRAFVDSRTEGFDVFAADIRAEPWDVIVEQSGVPRVTIAEAARVAMRSHRMIVCWAMGITQHATGVANIQTIANFALMRGHVGRPPGSGSGLCPVRGHSNVQGDRTMGIWEKMPDAFMSKLGAEFAFTPPKKHGLDVVQSLRAMHEGSIKVFFGMGGNLLGASPDTHFTAAAMRNCSLTVQVSTKLNRGHLVTGRTALILPCKGRTEKDRQRGGEQFVTVEDSMGKVHASKGVLEPASEHLKSEVEIVCDLARAVLGDRSTVDWESMSGNYDLIRDRISRVVPGFDRCNERVREKGGFYVANGPRDGVFITPSGKARFIAHPIPRWDLAPDQLLLMTMRTHDQFNTTVYGEDDRYRGIKGGRRIIYMNREDIADRGLNAGDRVDITSWFGDGPFRNGRFSGENGSQPESRIARSFMVVAYDIPRKCAAGYFPEMNVLVPIGSVAKGSGQPASKSVVITVARSE